MKPGTFLLIGGVICLLLVLKLFKQFVYMTFTMLTLKAVWILLIILYLLVYVRKYTQTRNTKE